ncbi:MAG: carboxymuconolactone decarboxylase family protein [Planctomycetes bacterium]|nr:carboxymuconolactone decarboxylase family protein [Planctomycetota bacterium]
MDSKTKELIAIGASVTANCVPCLKFHLSKARENGARDRDIADAVRVGRIVRKGAGGKWDEEAGKLLGQLSEAGSEGSASGSACGDL